MTLPYVLSTPPSDILLMYVCGNNFQNGPLTVVFSDFSVTPFLPWKQEALSCVVSCSPFLNVLHSQGMDLGSISDFCREEKLE